MVEGAECVGKSYSMWGKGLSAWDCVECVEIMCRCAVFLCTVYYMVYYAAFLLFFVMLCCVVGCGDILRFWGFLQGGSCSTLYLG